MIEDMINITFAMILFLLVGIMVPSWISDRAYQSLLNGIAVVCTTVAIATAGVAGLSNDAVRRQDRRPVRRFQWAHALQC